MAIKYIRALNAQLAQDGMTIESVEYNGPAGAKKTVDVGPKRIPIPIVTAGAQAYTCSAVTATALPKIGLNLAVYNNAGTVGSITFGEDSTVAVLAPGVTSIPTPGHPHVGVACPPNAWTYVSGGTQQWLIASASTLLVYIIEDDTFLSAVTY